ncbi:MAG: response regulator [Deltaproteobacteria bacterium]|nr:response regulator [Deltaproteobacteria bacterium]
MNRIAPQAVQEKDSLLYWRARILFAILFTGVLLSMFVFVPLFVLVFKQGLWGLAATDVIIWLGAVSLLVSPRWSYEIRATIMVSMLYIVGLGVVISVGPLSGGPAWLFAFAVLSGVLLGSKAAIRALAINTVTLAIIGWLMHTGRFGQSFPFFDTAELMILAGANFILLNAIAAMSVTVLVKSLVSMHQKERNLTGILERERSQLIDAKNALELEVDERRKAEGALRESEAKYRLLADNITDNIWTFDLNGWRFSYVSPSVVNLSGYSADEAMGLRLEDVLTPASLKLATEILHDEMAKTDQDVDPMRSRTLELEQYRKDGTTLWTEVSVRFMYDNEGHPSAILGVTRDISERKRLEYQIQLFQRMESLGTLAGGIAHDFNNLLMGIQGRISLLLMDEDPSRAPYEHLKEIENYVESASDLTRQLLGFARGGKYEIKPTDINHLLENSSAMFGRTKKEMTIHATYPSNVWAVEVDRGQIDQVLMNLFVNAWQAMPEGGDLYLKTENVMLDEADVSPFSVEPGKYVKISVTDTGVGMEKAIQERIFEPFFTTREMGRGVGLGLASAYGIIRNHGGFINVYSEKGKGTTFNIYLPASEKEVIEEKRLSEKVSKGSGTVMVVDDEELILDVLAPMLKRMGYDVLIARSGREAIQVYEENKDRIDIIVLDMVMPDMGGSETYDRISQMNPHVKVLLSSGYSINGQARKLLDRGCSDFIQKPFRVKQLAQKIREILDKKSC